MPYSSAAFPSRHCGAWTRASFGSVHQMQLSFWPCPCWGDCFHSERQVSLLLSSTPGWVDSPAACCSGIFLLSSQLTSLVVHVSMTVGWGRVVMKPPPVWSSVEQKRCFRFWLFGSSQYWLLISINGTNEPLIFVCIWQLRPWDSDSAGPWICILQNCLHVLWRHSLAENHWMWNLVDGESDVTVRCPVCVTIRQLFKSQMEGL